MRVRLAYEAGEELLAQLRRELRDGIDLSLPPQLGAAGKDTDDTAGDAALYEVLVAGRPSESQLDDSPSLRHVVVPFAGIPAVTRERVSARPALTLHNLHHNADATAEFAIALLLALAKRIPQGHQALRADDWSLRYARDSAIMLSGKRVFVLGYGAIGRRVAALSHALGMKVRAWRRGEESLSPHRLEETTAVEVQSAMGRDTEDLLRELEAADVLFLTLPLTEETRGCIGAQELQALGAGAFLVNVARGEVVDEEALYAALSSGNLAGAALDVWYRYPEEEAARSNTPPASFSFATLDNVVMSPHRAGHVVDIEARRAQALAELLNAAHRDGWGSGVDLSLGY